jgi:hypothetical protein
MALSSIKWHLHLYVAYPSGYGISSWQKFLQNKLFFFRVKNKYRPVIFRRKTQQLPYHEKTQLHSQVFH